MLVKQVSHNFNDSDQDWTLDSLKVVTNKTLWKLPLMCYICPWYPPNKIIKEGQVSYILTTKT